MIFEHFGIALTPGSFLLASTPTMSTTKARQQVYFEVYLYVNFICKLIWGLTKFHNRCGQLMIFEHFGIALTPGEFLISLGQYPHNEHHQS